MRETSRRDFLRTTSTAGLGLALAARAAAGRRTLETPPPAAYAAPEGFAAPALDRVRIGFVGVGLQGGSHVQNFLRIDGVEIPAICDVDETRAREVAQWVVDAGRAAPALHTRGETDYRRLCERDDVDLVFNSTPWRWHVPVCVAAMESGKHAAVEVPAAYTIDGCWELVETAERTLRHCVMMENCNYGRSELMVLRMVRAGLFGELLHGEGAYIHDLRAIKLSDRNEGLWRWQHSTTRNGNLYPTHGLGPIAQCMDVNRGDAFDRLVSMSSPARGLALWAREHLPEDDPRRDATFVLGDMNTSIIQTKLGRTILVQHDTTTPRPYSRINLIQGTRGVFTGYPDRIHVEGRTEGHGWDDVEQYREQFEHPLWRRLESEAEGAGHGGMDYLEDYRLVECLRQGVPTDMDVYDAAALSVVTELSEISVAEGGRPVEFPDFTRGRWRERTPLPIVGG
ncbi:MAG: Gfo/Idh/MocA family oxidoreductase [Thermoanaerobaculia bacterium]|nr:Gfo/Idh/MocA family oxidoreductase [Thermoanaerobaculia bacterium]